MLKWAESVKYLGVILTWNLDDRNEIMSQLRNFYARSNNICRTYKHCSIAIKLLLFEAFCVNVYLIHLWSSYPLFVFNRFRVATNNMLRKIVILPRFCSASEMHVFYRVDNIDARVRKARATFFQRLRNSTNTLIQNFLTSDNFSCCPLYLFILEQTL